MDSISGSYRVCVLAVATGCKLLNILEANVPLCRAKRGQSAVRPVLLVSARQHERPLRTLSAPLSREFLSVLAVRLLRSGI